MRSTARRTGPHVVLQWRVDAGVPNGAADGHWVRRTLSTREIEQLSAAYAVGALSGVATPSVTPSRRERGAHARAAASHRPTPPSLRGTPPLAATPPAARRALVTKALPR